MARHDVLITLEIRAHGRWRGGVPKGHRKAKRSSYTQGFKAREKSDKNFLKHPESRVK